MFNHRNFLHQSVFSQRLEQTRSTHEPIPRFIGFGRFVHDVLGWFDAQPALELVKLTCVLLPEFTASPPCIRLRHHFVLSALGGTVPSSEEYAIACLPWSLMSNGSFAMSRTDPLVQKYLTNDALDPIDYEALVNALALRIDVAFELVHIIQDVGLSASIV